ncbi:UGT-63 protein, partial [Aphelenchoides avenae]
LAEFGHDVVVFQTTTDGKPVNMGVANVSILHLDLPQKGDINGGQASIISRVWREELHAPQIGMLYRVFADAANDVLDRGSAELADVANQDWDLVVLDAVFGVHAYGFAHILKKHGVPYVVFCVTNFLSSDAYRQALGQNWAAKADAHTPLPLDSNDKYDPRNFFDRLTNFFEHSSELLTMEFADRFYITPAMRKMGVSSFSMNKLYADAAYAQYDGIERLGWPISSGTNVLTTGYTCESAGELAREYQEFVEDPRSKGTIYVAFGTFVDWHYAPTDVRDSFFEALNQLTDYRIIFSYKGPAPTTLAKHVMLTAWAPQQELLAHPKTKVFVTHSGLKSLREALCTKTPVVLMPMYNEQPHNAKFAVSVGMGTVLNKYKVNKRRIFDALTE